MTNTKFIVKVEGLGYLARGDSGPPRFVEKDKATTYGTPFEAETARNHIRAKNPALFGGAEVETVTEGP